MKIVLTRSMLPGDVQYIKDGLDREIAGRYELVIPESFTEERICAAAADAEVLLGPFVTKGILSAAQKLRLIQVPWTGMDTFDFSAVQDCAVPVCNTHSNADAVAEMGLAMVLDLLKKLSYHDRKMRVGSWNRDQQPLNLKSRMLSRQTVCVLGYGNIGSRIGKRLAAFGAAVIAVDGHAVPDGVLSAVYRREQIGEALEKADVVVCALPLTDTTRGMIGDRLFGCMKEGTILVNLSRAAVVDEDAAWRALESGRLGAFGADVWWNSPKRGESQSWPSAKYPFWERDNVLMSPHRAGFIEDCLPHLDGAIDNIIALPRGEKLSGVVDVKKEY